MCAFSNTCMHATKKCYCMNDLRSQRHGRLCHLMQLAHLFETALWVCGGNGKSKDRGVGDEWRWDAGGEEGMKCVGGEEGMKCVSARA